MGAGHGARPGADARPDRGGRRDRRPAGAESASTRTSPAGSPSPTSAVRPRTLDRRPHRVPGPQRRPRAPPAGAGRRGRACPAGAGGRASTPAPPCRRRSSCSPARKRRSSSCSARPPSVAEVRRLVGRYREPGRARAAFEEVRGSLGSRSGHRAGADAEPRPGPAAQPLAAVSGAQLPRLGPLGASTSPAAPTASATSSRTSWPWSTPRRRRRAPRSCCAGGAAVPRRRRAALVAPARRRAASARASPTTSSGCRSSSATTSRPPATRPSSTSRCRSCRRRC